MKKVVVFAFGLAMTLGFAQDANAWWWEKKEVDCTANLSVKLGEGPVEVSFEESWEGKKNVCRTGDSWCWGSSCS